MAYLRLDKDLNFDEDWVKEMRLVSEGLADEEYCHKLAREAPIAVKYLQEHGVKFVHHDEPNVLLEFKTAQHFVFPEGGGKAIISNLFDHIRGYKNCDILYQTEAIKLLTDDSGAIKGLKVRKTDGLLHDLIAPNVVLACGGFEGEWRRMKARRLC
jgi:tricarballylate dehydrogenase